MSWKVHIVIILSIIVIISVHCVTFTKAANVTGSKNFALSRDHVSVWFDSPLSSHRYEKKNLEGMIKLVSGTFGTIAIDHAYAVLPKLRPFEKLQNDRMLIPGITAGHNRISDLDKQLKLIISFDLLPSSGINNLPEDWKSEFEVAKFYADEANSIFPGTVETLLLHHDDYLRINANEKPKGHEEIPQQLHSAWEILNHDKNSNAFAYKLGVTISLELCGSGQQEQPNNYTKILSKFVEYADMVVPMVYDFNHKFLQDDEHKMHVAVLQNCERIIKKFKPEVEVIPIVICQPGKSRSVADTSQFFRCWQLMSDWAQENNRKVIMYEAFDRGRSEYATKSGYWRMKNEAYVEVVNETSFVEKVKVDLNTRIKIDGLTAVFFEHQVRYVPHLPLYFEEEIQAMLQVISTRFSTIITGKKPYITRLVPVKSGNDLVFTNFTWVAELAAELNKEKENTASFKPLSIIATFYRPDRNVWNPQSSTIDSLLDFGVTLEVVKSANEIFPGTVTSLAYHKFSYEILWNVSDIDIFKKNLVIELGPMNTESHFRFGTFVDLSACFDFESHFYKLSPWLTFVILDISDNINADTSHISPDSLLRKRILEWTHCREVFQKNFPEVEIMMAVNCREVAKDGLDLLVEDMARCAHFIGEWGKENHVEVILSQAFDVPMASAGGNINADPNGGWWKLRRKSEVNITRDSFVEKILDIGVKPDYIWENGSDFSSRFSWEVVSARGCEKKGSNNTGYIVSLVMLVIICGVLGVLVVYFYDRIRIKRPFRRDDSELQVLNVQ